MHKTTTEDSLITFDRWLRKNGFLDVAECVPEEVDLDRLHKAIELYSQGDLEEQE